MYEVSLLGENLLYSSVNPQYLFLKSLFKIARFVSAALFSRIFSYCFLVFCGVICDWQFLCISGNVMMLFLPIYVICVGTMQLNSLFFAKIINTVNVNIPSVDAVGQAMENAEKIKEQTGRLYGFVPDGLFCTDDYQVVVACLLLAWALV